jgi:hypothetical protein
MRVGYAGLFVGDETSIFLSKGTEAFHMSVILSS